MYAQELLKRLGVTSPVALQLAEDLDRNRGLNKVRKDSGQYKAAAIALKRSNVAWTRGGRDGGGHGYCDDAEERDGLAEDGTTRLSSRKVVRAAKATRRPAPIIGKCAKCEKAYKRAAALTAHQASCSGLPTRKVILVLETRVKS